MSQIINPNEKQDNTESDKQYYKELVEKLNIRDASKGGHWQYTPEYGIVWVLDGGDSMGTLPSAPSEPVPGALTELIEWGKQVDFDKLGNNSVLTVKIGLEDPVYSAKLQYAIVKQVLEPRAETLKEKKTTVLFMAAGDDISIISEEDMEKAGWQKKDKSRIIIPR